MNQRSYPDDCAYSANNKGKALTIESHFAYAGDNNFAPKQIFAKMSRFVFTIIDKNLAPQFATANMRCDEFAAFHKKVELAYEENRKFVLMRSAAVSSGGESPAYTVKFATGVFSGKTPAQVLLEDPDNAQALNKQFMFLKNNLQRFPKNQIQMDAIKEAAALFKEGKLVKNDVPNGFLIPIQESKFRFLDSRPKQNGKTFCYELIINCNVGNDYPFYVEISNYYAPVRRDETGKANLELRGKEDLNGNGGKETIRSINLTADDFYNMVDEMACEMADYRNNLSAKAHADADRIRKENIAAAQRSAV